MIDIDSIVRLTLSYVICSYLYNIISGIRYNRYMKKRGIPYNIFKYKSWFLLSPFNWHIVPTALYMMKLEDK